MRKRLTKVGNSQAVILSKETLELLGIPEGGEVELQVLGKVLTLHAPDVNPLELQAALAFSAVLAEDQEVLERLADA
jgi:antitoxin component of MazEF toxin-antitoxin module